MSTATEIETLILTGEGYGTSVSADALAEKAALIKAASAITVVTTNEQADEARAEVKKLAAVRNQVEKSRKKIKEPVLTIGKQIDDLAKSYLADLEQEEKRLTGLIGSHAAEVERQRQEAIRKQQEEERKRLAAEAEAKRIAEEAERARIAAEAEAEKARKAAEAAMWEDGDADAEKAKAEAAKAAAAAEAERARIAAEAAEKQRLADEAAAAAQTSSLVANTAAPAGTSFYLDYEVEDIAALYSKHPQLVELSPRRSEILAMLKMLAPSSPDGLPTLAGLKVVKKPRVSTR